MEGRRSLSAQLKHFEQTFKKNGLKCSIHFQNDQNAVIHTRINTRLNSPLATYITLSSGLFGDETIVVSFTAVLNNPVSVTDEIEPLAAFLNQMAMLVPHLTFLLDLQTKQILIRQQFISATKYLVDFRLFLESILLIAPLLEKSVSRLTSQSLTTADARLMADLLTDECYGVMAL